MKKVLIDGVDPTNTRIALINDSGVLEELQYAHDKPPIQGNIYLAKITKIELSLQAAFIVYDNDKSGFLPFDEIHPAYYEDKNQKPQLADVLKKILLPEDFLNVVDVSTEPLTTQPAYADDGLSGDIVNIDSITQDNSQDDNINLMSEDIDNIELATDSSEQTEKTSLEQKQYKIQDVIRNGQLVLVQVQKEERGTKSAYFSTYVSLTGKYSIFRPNVNQHNGVSKKILHSDERKRLKAIVVDLLAKTNATSCSIIIRTAGLHRSVYEIRRDYKYLAKLWNNIIDLTLAAQRPRLIHTAENLVTRAIRDLFDHRVDELIIQGMAVYTEAVNFVAKIVPEDLAKVKEHSNASPIFTFYKIEDQIFALYQPTCLLKSGGYIVINPTEALTAIDVNSGKSTSEENIEDTALKTNIEAAKTIVRQIKLRDISGIIVIDFIDMFSAKNRTTVEHTMKSLFATEDSARIHVGSISTFGLLTLSRQRTRPSFLESHTVACHHCSGKGVVRSETANAALVLRAIENELQGPKVAAVHVYAHKDVIISLFNSKKVALSALEEQYNTKINLYNHNSDAFESFSIEKNRSNHRTFTREIRQLDPKISPSIIPPAAVLNGTSAAPRNNLSRAPNNRKPTQRRYSRSSAAPRHSNAINNNASKVPDIPQEPVVDVAPKNNSF